MDDISDGQISGTTILMEYSTSVNGPYVACTDGTTSVESGTYFVRFKADETHVASDIVMVVVPFYVP